MKKILFLTNGRGEELVAGEISKRLPGDFNVTKISLANTKLPGGGFSLRNPWFLMRDLSAGLIGSTLENIRTLKKLRGGIDLTVAVGDIVPIIGSLLVKAPFVFVGVNKSDYYRWFGYRYTPWEKWLLKKYAQKIYVRDRLTMENLNRQGIPAEYAGNPLMDCLTSPPLSPSPSLMERGKPEAKRREGVRIGFLPGTREDAKLNLEDFEKIIEGLINLKDPDLTFRFLIATALPNVPEYMERKPFSEVLAESGLVVGLSGTGNEQAAGYGIPVVSFYGRGAQYGRKFAQAQKQLLGDALALVKSQDHRAVAAAIMEIVRNDKIFACMSRAGKERMGEGGAVEKIAAYILSQTK